MRWFVLWLCVLTLVGCNDRREVRPAGADADYDDFTGAFERETAQNKRMVAIANEPPIISRGGATTGGEAVADAPVVVAGSPPPMRPVDPYTADYRASTVTTIRGPIVGMRRIPLSHDRTGLLAKVNVGGEFPEVYLGPQEWLLDQGIAPEITQALAVTGSSARTAEGSMLVIAREATMGDVTVPIRDVDGKPFYPVPADTDETKP